MQGFSNYSSENPTAEGHEPTCGAQHMSGLCCVLQGRYGKYNKNIWLSRNVESNQKASMYIQPSENLRKIFLNRVIETHTMVKSH